MKTYLVYVFTSSTPIEVKGNPALSSADLIAFVDEEGNPVAMFSKNSVNYFIIKPE